MWHNARISPMAACLFLVAALGIGSIKAQADTGDSGFTFGLFGQGSWSDIEFTETLVAPPYTQETGDGDIDGFGFGVSLGYDLYVDPRWMVGIEFDLARSNDWRTDYDFRPTMDMVGFYEIDWAMSFRGRFGYKFTPEMLGYLTAGYARASVSHGAVIDSAPQATYKADGWVFGLGGEYDFGPVSLFAEYLYTDYKTGNIPELHGERHDIDLDTNTVRFGLKVKFPGE